MILEMRPDPDFVNKLYRLDRDLVLCFDREMGRWQIWRKDADSGRLEFIINVINDDGSYRPLDDRTINILKMNRFYAENPDLLIKTMIDDENERREKAIEKTLDNLKSVSKDRALKKEFERIRELAASVSAKEWQKPIVAKDEKGRVLRDLKGNVVCTYKPHISWLTKGA